MKNKHQFFDWQDDYYAAEWKDINEHPDNTLESGVHSVAVEDDGDLTDENTTQGYVKSYYQDLNTRRSHILSLRLLKIALIFGGFITLVFIPKAPLKAKMDEILVAFQGQNQGSETIEEVTQEGEGVETLASACATETPETTKTTDSETTQTANSEDCEVDSITDFVNKIKEFKEKRNHHNEELQKAIDQS